MKKTIFLLFCMVLSVSMYVSAQRPVNIWQGTPCKHRVQLTPWLAEGKGNRAVVVCPGGSYFWHDMKHEGEQVARWLQSQGISAFVLRYRTAYVPAYLFRFRYVVRGNRYPDALDDVRQSLRYIRSHADALGIDTAQIMVMGFSAGGHLAMLAAEQLPVGERPKAVAAIYPVVTMEKPYVHKRSRRALMGESRLRNAALRDSLSVERHVPSDCPPVFLVNCKDDPIVDYHNSELLDSALTAKGIRHQYLQYSSGGHGFGADPAKGSAESRGWMEAFLKWIHLNEE